MGSKVKSGPTITTGDRPVAMSSDKAENIEPKNQVTAAGAGAEAETQPQQQRQPKKSFKRGQRPLKQGGNKVVTASAEETQKSEEKKPGAEEAEAKKAIEPKKEEAPENKVNCI